MGRRHVYLSHSQLLERLGLEGKLWRLWEETDNDFVHIIVEGEGEGFVEHREGIYVDSEDISEVEAN